MTNAWLPYVCFAALVALIPAKPALSALSPSYLSYLQAVADSRTSCDAADAASREAATRYRANDMQGAFDVSSAGLPFADGCLYEKLLITASLQREIAFSGHALKHNDWIQSFRSEKAILGRCTQFTTDFNDQGTTARDICDSAVQENSQFESKWSSDFKALPVQPPPGASVTKPQAQEAGEIDQQFDQPQFPISIVCPQIGRLFADAVKLGWADYSAVVTGCMVREGPERLVLTASRNLSMQAPPYIVRALSATLSAKYGSRYTSENDFDIGMAIKNADGSVGQDEPEGTVRILPVTVTPGMKRSTVAAAIRALETVNKIEHGQSAPGQSRYSAAGLLIFTPFCFGAFLMFVGGRIKWGCLTWLGGLFVFLAGALALLWAGTRVEGM